MGEKLSEVYLGPFVGGASRSGLRMCWRWCSFFQASQGLFGEKLLIAYEIRGPIIFEGGTTHRALSSAEGSARGF